MNVLYIGHSYHVRTSSTLFFIDMLRKHSKNVDVMVDESWAGGPELSVEAILSRSYDQIVVFQMTSITEALAKKVPERLVFVPMYDSSHSLPDRVWAGLSKVRMVNFSRTLHDLHRSFGMQSLYVQYFPNPADYSVVSGFKDLRGFFWLRKRNLGWPVIRRLAENARWSKFLLHNEPDPVIRQPKPSLRRFFRKLTELCGLRKPSSSEPELPVASDIERFNIVISRWIDDKSEFNRKTGEANVFFASRRYEGIGMSFLEAMARGQCVVAPGRPTHSEYLVHGTSGLLYDPDSASPLDFARATSMGAAARKAVEHGFPRWKTDLNDRLPEFVFGSQVSRL